MTQPKIATVLMNYTVDSASLQKGLVSNKMVAGSYDDIAAAAKSLGLTEAELRSLAGASEQAAVKSGLLARVWDENARAANGFQRELADIQRAEASAIASTTQQAAAVDTLASRYKDVKAAAEDARRAQTLNLSPSVDSLTGRGNAAVVSGLRQARDAAIALPGVGYQSPLTVGIRALEFVAKSTGASFTKLGATVGAVGVFAAGAALAVEAFNASLERGQNALKAALVAQDNYYKALATLTTEQVNQQIEQLRAARPLLEQQLAETRNALSSQFGENVLTDPLGVGRFQRGLAKLITPDAFEALEAQGRALDENIQTEARLTQGREAGAFVANDMRAAEDDLRKAREAASEQARQELFQNIDQTMATNLRLAELRRNGTTEQVDALLAENSDREQLLRNFAIPAAEAAATSEAGKAKLEAYRNELNELLRTDELLLSIILPLVQARDAETQAVQDQLSVIADSIGYYQQLAEQIRNSTVEQVEDRLHALQEEAAALRLFIPELEKLAPTSADAAAQLEEARKRLGQIGDDYADQMIRVLPAALLRAQQQLREDINKIRTESAAKERQIEVERGEKEADAQRDRDKAYLDAEEKRGADVAKLAEDQAVAREKIERRANATIANAIFARNSLAAYLAEQQKKEDLADLRSDGERRAREIDKQFDEQKRVADRRYREQLDAARVAADKAIKVERDKAKAEIDEKVAAYNRQITALHTFTDQGTTYIYDFVNDALVGLAHLVTQAKGLFAGASGVAGGVGGAVGSVLSGIGAPLGFIANGLGGSSPVAGTMDSLDNLVAPPRGSLPGMGGSGGSGGVSIFSPATTRGMLQGGGNGLTINLGGIHGSQWRKRDVLKLVDQKLRSTLDQMEMD